MSRYNEVESDNNLFINCNIISITFLKWKVVGLFLKQTHTSYLRNRNQLGNCRQFQDMQKARNNFYSPDYLQASYFLEQRVTIIKQ